MKKYNVKNYVRYKEDVKGRRPFHPETGIQVSKSCHNQGSCKGRACQGTNRAAKARGDVLDTVW